jgi:hypothetical protein
LVTNQAGPVYTATQATWQTGRPASKLPGRQLSGAVVTSGPLHATLLLADGEGRWVLQPGPRCNYTFTLHRLGSDHIQQPVIQPVSGAKPQAAAAAAAAAAAGPGKALGRSGSAGDAPTTTPTTTSSSSSSSSSSHSRGVGHRPYASQVAGIIAVGVGGPLLLCACLAAVAYRRSQGEAGALVSGVTHGGGWVGGWVVGRGQHVQVHGGGPGVGQKVGCLVGRLLGRPAEFIGCKASSKCVIPTVHDMTPRDQPNSASWEENYHPMRLPVPPGQPCKPCSHPQAAVDAE